MSDSKAANFILERFAILLVVGSLIVVAHSEIRQAGVTDKNVSEGVVLDTILGDQADAPTIDFTSVVREDQYRLRLTHPAEAQVSEIAGEIQVMFVGANSTLDSEITDGYQVIITTHVADLETHLSSLSSVVALQAVKINEHQGFSFLEQSDIEGVGIEQIVFSPQKDIVVAVTYEVAGDTETIYRERVLSIIKSIELIDV